MQFQGTPKPSESSPRHQGGRVISMQFQGTPKSSESSPCDETAMAKGREGL